MALEFNIKLDGGLGWMAVSLDGVEVGAVERKARAPKRWVGTLDGVEVGRGVSATEAGFAVALAAHDARTKASVLAKLGGGS